MGERPCYHVSRAHGGAECLTCGSRTLDVPGTRPADEAERWAEAQAAAVREARAAAFEEAAAFVAIDGRFRLRLDDVAAELRAKARAAREVKR